MKKSPIARKKHHFEGTKRSLVKAITFRIIILCADTIVIYGITKRVDVTAGVVFISNISSTVLYFIHERIWNGISWGKYQK